jgi:hypothetical protein
MKSSMKFVVAVGFLSAVLGLALPHQTRAAGLVIDCNRVTTENGKPIIENPCTIQDFFQQFVIIAHFAYGLIVILGVLMIIYGGYQFLIAGGRQEKVTEGKRIITGTIIGIIITASAYVIINFAVAAFTGKSDSLNPLTGIAQVFVNDPELTQPFSGKTGTKVASCHTDWDHTCSATQQVYCSDLATSGGPIALLQKKLNDDKHCNCGGADGCFGSATVACVRRFQIANFLPPTGAIDSTTRDKINGPGTACDSGALVASEISGRLPAVNISYSGIKSADSTGRGCCVVQGPGASGDVPFYCLDQVSKRTCVGLGSGNKYTLNTTCANGPETKGICGTCSDSKNGKNCFENSTKHWCLDIISPSELFDAGPTCTARGSNCAGSCSQGLQMKTPFK